MILLLLHPKIWYQNRSAPHLGKFPLVLSSCNTASRSLGEGWRLSGRRWLCQKTEDHMAQFLFTKKSQPGHKGILGPVHPRDQEPSSPPSPSCLVSSQVPSAWLQPPAPLWSTSAHPIRPYTSTSLSLDRSTLPHLVQTGPFLLAFLTHSTVSCPHPLGFYDPWFVFVPSANLSQCHLSFKPLVSPAFHYICKKKKKTCVVLFLVIS